MSKDYVADNEGTGFASFDDDGPSDLESLLAGAALGEEEDDQETASFFTDSEPEPQPPKREEAPKTSPSLRNTRSRREPKQEEPVAPPVIFKAPTPVIDDEEEYEDLPVPESAAYSEFARGQRSWEMDPNPTMTAPEPAPVPAPTAAPAPAHVPHSFAQAPVATNKTVPARRAPITNETEEIAMAGKVIRIIDAYRKLSSEVQTIASQFITNGSEIIEDEATLVIKVINANHMLSVTMKALREAKALDPVERVFYVIGLDDDVLHSLGELVSVFTSNTLDGSIDKIAYARTLVREIEQLDARAVNYVESTESILAAANGESN